MRLLARETAYDVPDQDLRVPLGRVPARPVSGFIVERVRRTIDVRDAEQSGTAAAEPLRPSFADER